MQNYTIRSDRCDLCRYSVRIHLNQNTDKDVKKKHSIICYNRHKSFLTLPTTNYTYIIMYNVYHWYMGQDARANKLKPTECLYAHERKDMQKENMCLRCIEILMFNIQYYYCEQRTPSKRTQMPK